MLPGLVQPVAEALAGIGSDAAEATYHRLAAASPSTHDPDDDLFVDAVWGAIELHRTELVWPLLRLWTRLRPASSPAWGMTGWAHKVDGDPLAAATALGRAVALDPDNDEAATLLSDLG